MEHNQIAAIMRGMDPEDIGVAVSVALTWDGNAIFRAMLAALTDANFHTEAKALEKTWQDLKD
jgi:hypothetical protein